MARDRQTRASNADHANSRRSSVLVAAGAVLALGIAAYGLFNAATTMGGLPAEDVALVNGRHILRSDFIAQTEIIYAMPFETTTAEQRQRVLDDMINEELLVQRGLEIDLAASDPDLRAALVAGVNSQVTADIVSREPTEEELHAYYEANRQQYAGEGMMQLVDLYLRPTDELTPVEAGEAARAAAAELRSGAPLNAVMAKYNLMDSGKIDEDEVFDFVARIRLGEEIYNIAAMLQPGEVSEPFTLRGDINGDVHIVEMITRRPAVPRSFEAARDAVLIDYTRDASRQIEAENVNALKSRSEIVIAPEFRQ
jgi:parvulin-like peptidyl-prolyl isomerase